MDPDTTASWIVPSPSWPSLAAALARATDGTHIEVLPDYSEVIIEPLILDCSICIEGPRDCSAKLLGEEGIVIAGHMVGNAVVLRRLHLKLSSAPALLIAGGCMIDNCIIEGAEIGIEVTARSGSAVRILNNRIRNCGTGISLSGGAAAALAGTRVEDCSDAVVITGLDVKEGWNEVFGAVEDIAFVNNSGANLTLRGWSIYEQSGAVRLAPPGEQITVRGWPQEACNVIAPTDHGPVVLHFIGGKVNTTLFEDDYEGGTIDDDDKDACTSPTYGFRNFQMEVSPEESLPMQESTEP